jgi:TolB protein
MKKTGGLGIQNSLLWWGNFFLIFVIATPYSLLTTHYFSEVEAGPIKGTSPQIIKERQITFHPEEDFIPSWSPDGSKIAFTSYRSGGEEIWTMDPEGGSLTQLTRNTHGDWSPAWSPDGNLIAFTSDQTGLNQIWLMNADGSHQRALTSYPKESSIWNRDPSWSPDGKKLIYTSNRSGKDENWIMDLSTKETWLHSDGMAEHWHPSFSPNGEQILFSSNMTGEWGLWLSDLSGKGLIRMVPERKFDNNPAAAWSPDGGRIVFRTAEADLWLINADGTGATPLTRDGKVEGWRSTWSPDGRQIAYTASRSESGNSDVWVITLR